MTRAAIATTLALTLGACFSPSYDHPTCGPEGQCPSGYECVGGTCQEDITDVDGAIDSPIDSPIDAPIDSPIDAPIDAAIDATPIDGPPIDAAIDAAPLSCNVGDVQSPSDPSRCFHRITAMQPWNQQRATCQSMGGDLTDVRGPNEQTALMPLCNAGVELWIGGRDNSLVLNYEWVSNFPFNFQAWGAGQPNNPQGCIRLHCTGAAVPAEWWDQECTLVFGAVCVLPAH